MKLTLEFLVETILDLVSKTRLDHCVPLMEAIEKTYKNHLVWTSKAENMTPASLKSTKLDFLSSPN
jgi:hypothetical protein